MIDNISAYFRFRFVYAVVLIFTCAITLLFSSISSFSATPVETKEPLAGAMCSLLIADIDHYLKHTDGDGYREENLRSGLGAYLSELGHVVYRFQSGSNHYIFPHIKDSLISIGLIGRLANSKINIRDRQIQQCVIKPIGKKFREAKYATIKIHPMLIDSLLQSGLFDYLEVDTKVGLALSDAREQSNVASTHLGVELDRRYLGNNVIFGLVDVGMDYRHRTFQDSNGKSRILESWLQGDGITGSNAYGYGKILKGDELLARVADIETESHSTHVAGIAAGIGNGRNDLFLGIAPNCDIVSVSNAYTFDGYDNTGQSTILDGVDYIFGVAESRNRPCVINLSLASNIGPHDGSAIFDEAVSELTGIGKIVVTAAGNDGDTRLHSSGYVEGDNSIRTFVEQNTQFQYNFVDIWAEKGENICFRVGVRMSSEIIWDDEEFCTASNMRVDGRIASIGYDFNIITRSAEFNGKPRIFFRSEDSFVDRVCIEVSSPTGANVHIWNCGPGGSSGEDLTSNNYPGFTGGDTDYTIGEIGGNSPDILTVGAYTSSFRYNDTGGNTRIVANNDDQYRLAFFSSKGPTVSGEIKPDIAAPGNIILSSISARDKRYQPGGSLYEFLVEIGNSVNGNSPFGAQSGTSMSSPVAAGAVALMLEANPYLSEGEVIKIIRETAMTDQFTGPISEDGDNFWGKGKLDIHSAVQMAELYFKSTNLNSNISLGPNPVENGRVSFIFEENSAGTYDINLYDYGGRVVKTWKEDLVSSGTPRIDIELNQFANGYYFIHITNGVTSLSTPIIISQPE